MGDAEQSGGASESVGVRSFAEHDGASSPATIHFHVCEKCCKPWLHEKRAGMTPAQRDEYHMCPQCGSGPYRFAYDTMRDALAVAFWLNSDEPSAENFGKKEKPMRHELLDGTLVNEGRDRGIAARCTCGWESTGHFSSASASAAFRAHQGNPSADLVGERHRIMAELKARLDQY
jgi:hypothetical protein